MSGSVTVLVGDLLSSECQTLVNTVNTVGVMGKGIAAAFKAKYPDMYKDYRARCEIEDFDDPKKVLLGRPYLYIPPPDQLGLLADPSPPKWILNFPTKDHWRGPSHWEAILGGLDYLEAHFEEWGIRSMAVPPLGCGHGGLEWALVGPQLYERLSRLEIPIELYAPFGTKPDELDEGFLDRTTDWSSSKKATVPFGELAIAIAASGIAVDSGEPLNKTELRSLAYWLSQSGIERPTDYSWGRWGIRDGEFEAMLGRLIRNALIVEVEVGRGYRYRPGRTLPVAHRLVAENLTNNESSIRAATRMFRNTRRWAPIAPSIHYLQQTADADIDVSEAEVIANRLVETGIRKNRDSTLREVERVQETLNREFSPPT